MMMLKFLGVDPHRATGGPGWTILAVAPVLGLFGDLLLRARPWGLNVAIWLTALCVVALVLPQLDSKAFSRPRRSYWLWAALGFSLMLAWRSSPLLQALNVLVVFLCLGMVAFRPAARAIHRAGSIELVANLAVSGFQLGTGLLVLVIRYLDWRPVRRTTRSAQLASAGRGLAIAVLPLIVFATLFASADVFFRDLLREVGSLAPRDALSHLLLFTLFTWLAGGYLWGALLSEPESLPWPVRPHGLVFEYIEVGVVFGLVDALFLAFVVVQFRYLFGGAARVESSSTLTYAEYARRGFFELVAVAALVALFLLVTHWLLPQGYSRLRRFYAGVAGVLVVLVFVVMASALERMRLYQQTFGLTELRVYTTAFIVWLGVLFVWLTLTVLRGRRDQFAFGGVVAALVVVVGLNAVNPEALIVRRNAAIADGGHRPFDTAYALNLSSDAVPTIIANFDDVPAADRCTAARELRRRYLDERDDWRSWSWGLSRARRAVSSSTELATACAASSSE